MFMRWDVRVEKITILKNVHMILVDKISSNIKLVFLINIS